MSLSSAVTTLERAVSGGQPAAEEAPVRPPGVRAAVRYVPEVESLRGIAILLVLFYHGVGFVDGTRGRPLGFLVSPVSAFVHAGHTGVSLFFVLSAFLLSQPFLAEAAGGRRVLRSHYYARRALRIIPLYWTVVLATSVVLARNAMDLLRGVPYLLFLNSFPGFNNGLAPLNSVWWSLATEVQFYLLLPLLPVFLVSRARRWLGLLVLLGYAAAYAVFVGGGLRPQSLEGRILLAHSCFGRAPLFTAGITAAWVYTTYGSAIRKRWSEAGWAATVAGDLLLIIVFLSLSYLLRYVVFEGYWIVEFTWPAWHLAEGILWALVLIVLLTTPGRLKPLLSNRVLRTIGLWSYSIYLLHVPLLYLSLRWLHFAEPGTFGGWTVLDVGRLALFAGASIGLSSLSYWAIERPFLVRKAQLDC